MVLGLLQGSALLAAVPEPVSNLSVAAVNTAAVRLEWLQRDCKESCSYLVLARHASAAVQNATTAIETYTFINLTPGEWYDFDVFTVVGGVKSEVKTISSETSKTRPSLVTDWSSGSTRRSRQLNPLDLCCSTLPQDLLQPLVSPSKPPPGT